MRPYLHEFGTWAKGRWLGRPLLEVVSGEFGGHPMSYWQRAVRTGLVSVNGRPTTPDYLLRNGDRLTHLTHRHEPAVQGSVLLVGEVRGVYLGGHLTLTDSDSRRQSCWR